jgi:Ni/Fe-hydrogenase subunit HybB-like protein
LTGVVAGAFILASLERVFNVREVQPTYRLSLLTALAFLIVAPLPLLAHLGHPERCFAMFLTPNLHSAMAMFGFVYAWYLMVVLLLEIWFDYRKDLIWWARAERGQIDSGHAALAELALEAVAIGQRRAEGVEGARGFSSSAHGMRDLRAVALQGRAKLSPGVPFSYAMRRTDSAS